MAVQGKKRSPVQTLLKMLDEFDARSDAGMYSTGVPEVTLDELALAEEAAAVENPVAIGIVRLLLESTKNQLGCDGSFERALRDYDLAIFFPPTEQ